MDFVSPINPEKKRESRLYCSFYQTFSCLKYTPYSEGPQDLRAMQQEGRRGVLPHLQDCLHGKGLRHGGLCQRALWGVVEVIQSNSVNILNGPLIQAHCTVEYLNLWLHLSSVFGHIGMLFLGLVLAFVQLINSLK